MRNTATEPEVWRQQTADACCLDCCCWMHGSPDWRRSAACTVRSTRSRSLMRATLTSAVGGPLTSEERPSTACAAESASPRQFLLRHTRRSPPSTCRSAQNTGIPCEKKPES
ncbi:hypothetical protein EVAR_18850_1 [Eumeta japonica]|uniref:Uncharacterized protein n=1 Tax=Eumeta variegata TaxID=151549 RepID=A0A4C1ULM9_EUMVA|nr:hypothetical protein EVAR_18850_1 [Eumeta japonica]